jgi:RecJ-like exonuclease
MGVYRQCIRLHRRKQLKLPLSFFLKILLYYQKIKKNNEGMDEKMTQTNQTVCPYCSGNGYVQLVLGGSETCYCCSGKGTAVKDKQ